MPCKFANFLCSGCCNLLPDRTGKGSRSDHCRRHVTLSDSRNSYGGVKTIHGVDLDIRDGEFFVLVGPSGCGKSTLLRMTAGLETFTGGTLKIGARRVNDLDPKDRDVVMVFQSYAPYPRMAVVTNKGF